MVVVLKGHGVLLFIEGRIELLEESCTEVNLANVLRSIGELEEQFVGSVSTLGDVLSGIESNIRSGISTSLKGEGDWAVFRESWEFVSFTNVAEDIGNIGFGLETRESCGGHEIVESRNGLLSVLSRCNVGNVNEFGSGVEISNETLRSLENASSLGLDVRDGNSPGSLVNSWDDSLVCSLGEVLVDTSNVELSDSIVDIKRELFRVNLFVGGKQLRNDAVGRASKSETGISELQCSKIAKRSSLINSSWDVEIVSEIFFIDIDIGSSCENVTTSKFSFSTKDGSCSSLSGSLFAEAIAVEGSW